MAEKIRVDIALVRQGKFESREKAQAAIMAGLVFQGQTRINKPSETVAEDIELTVHGSATPYVGRGGLKLEKAVQVFRADLKNKTCMDIGCATGGFTDVCLQNGAAHVYAIDVGYGQFDWKLRNDPRVTLLERTNARYLTPEQVPLHPTVTVMDVSFISIKLILPVAAALMGEEGVFYTLIKPQFEAGRSHVGKNGVVRDADVHVDVLESIVLFAESMSWRVAALDFSPVTGPKGNIEFLAEIRHQSRVPQPQLTKASLAQTVDRAHRELRANGQTASDGCHES